MSWFGDLFYPNTSPEKLDDIDQGFADSLLTRWDIPWGKSDDEKDGILRGLIDERGGEL
jgi:hypothetical protein